MSSEYHRNYRVYFLDFLYGQEDAKRLFWVLTLSEAEFLSRIWPHYIVKGKKDYYKKDISRIMHEVLFRDVCIDIVYSFI